MSCIRAYLPLDNCNERPLGTRGHTLYTKTAKGCSCLCQWFLEVDRKLIDAEWRLFHSHSSTSLWLNRVLAWGPGQSQWSHFRPYRLCIVSMSLVCWTFSLWSSEVHGTWCQPELQRYDHLVELKSRWACLRRQGQDQSLLGSISLEVFLLSDLGTGWCLCCDFRVCPLGSWPCSRRSATLYYRVLGQHQRSR